MDTIYVVHPVTLEQKAELRKLGKIVDARFAPEGEEIIDMTGDEPADSGDNIAMTDDQIRDEIERITGKKPHHAKKRETLIAEWEELATNPEPNV